MAPQIPTEVRGALAQAKRVLGIVMRLKTSKILFNEPVDPVALGLDDYLDKVSTPMDFGTIMSRLQEGEKAGWKKCHYLKTENVLRDVQLVFDNCFAYNDGPGDEVTRELCSEVKANFEKRWREASLPLESVVQGSQAPSVPPEAQPVDWMGESDVPAELSYVQEDLSLPVRHLDAFQLCQLGDLANMEPLEDVDGVSESIVAQGQIIPAGAIAADGASESIHIRTGPLLSWALDYAGTLSVLVQTETTWYRLHSPAPFYAGTYTSVQQKVEICAVAHDVARTRKKLSPAAAAQAAATELGLAEDDEDIAFAEAQLLALAEISASGKAKDRKGTKAPAAGGRGRKRKASAEPGEDRDAGGRPALLVPGPPSMQAAAAKQLENADEDDLEPADEADEGGAESGGEETPVGEEEGALDDEEEKDQPKRKRRRRKRKRVIVQDDDDVPMTRKEKLAMWRARRLAAKAAEKEAANAERQAEATERAEHDRAAAEARGPAPEPARSFRLPQQLIPDLLVLWELLQTLAPTLQTPYIPLWRFEAALCPGPIKAGVPAVPELAQSPEEALPEPAAAAAEPQPQPEPDQAAESKEEDEQPIPPVKLRIKMGRGRKPKDASDAEAATPALAAPLPYIQPTDDAGVASGLVLRELHAAVLRGIDGRGGLGSIGAEAPRTAKLALSESQAAIDWTRRVSRVILDSPPFAVDDDARAAALHLAYAEYDDMSTMERMAILRGLCGLLLATDAAREVVGARLEAIAALQPKPKKEGEEGKDEDQGEEQKAEGSEAEDKPAPAPPPPAKKKSGKDSAKAAGNAPGSVEEWDKWVDACRVGVRQPLGVDYQGRIYRALGSRACAWRIFVEEPGEDPASSSWGYYEGDKILGLVAWLQKGEISTEEDLLEALAAAPLPRKGITAATKSIPGSGDKEAPPVVSAPELEARRWDGYRGMVAPQLLGSWNWPGAMLQAGYETRMRATIDALLCRLPFWYSGEDTQMASLEVYQAMSAATSPSDMARVLPLAEKLLCQAGLMRATWAEHWQHSWQRATSYCVDWKHALLLTASLQAQLRPDRNALSRPAFSRMAHDERCQLYFPVHGDQVVLLRTGVLMHIKKYMQTLGLLPLDIPEKPQAAEPPEEAQSEGVDLPADTGDEDEEAAEPVQAALQLPQQLDLPEAVKRGLKRQWHALQDTVQQLRPIERFRVVGVAFRRSFLDGSSEASFLDDLATDELQIGLALWPCAWILMEPSRKGPPFQTPHSPIAVPIRIDQALPDFLVRSDAFDKGMHRIWNAGDRFRMYFGGRAGSKSGGVYYRGQVAQVFDQQPDIEASEERQEQYDPWEAVEVIWDGGKSSSGYGGRVEAVNPWELEVDPDFERTEDEIKRDQEAEQRALRAAALAMRREEEDRAEAARKEAERDAAERAATQAAAERLRGSALRRAPSTPGDSGSDAAPLYMPPRPAAGSHGAVSADVLDMLRSLGEERFMTLLANWHRGVHGKFKVPVFAHQELDLFKVFWSVMEKGGYEIVSANKQWKEVCRCLDVDLTGQTSASFNMRQNYERCLFEFEDYLASGAYVADVNSERAPSADAVVPFHCRHPIAQLPAPGEPPKRVLLPEREPSEPRERPVPTREGSSRRRKYQDMDDIDDDDVVYDDEDDEEDFVLEESPQPTRRQGKGAQGGKGAKTFGPAMHAAGRALIGKLVLRYWEDQGGWWEALVGDYLIKSGKHKLIYDAGGEDESFETADLRTLTDDEIKPHSQHPLPGLSRLPALPTPAQPKAQPPLPAVPAVPGATPEQSTAMTAIVTALREGVPAEDLRGMLEAAAAALEAAAGQDRARAAPTTLLLGPPTFKAETSTPVAAPLDAVMAQEGSDREAGTSGAEDASGRRSGRLSVKIRLKSAARPSHSPGAGERRGRKRRLDPSGAAASEAEAAEAQQPERKRHRLATASRSASPMSAAPEGLHVVQEEGGQPNGLPEREDEELSGIAAHLGNGQIEQGSPELAPADHSHPIADSPIEVDFQIDTQIDMDPMPGPSALPGDAAQSDINDIGTADGAVLPAQAAHAADETAAPEMEAEQQGTGHGSEALSAAAEDERLQPADDVKMHNLLANASSTAAHDDLAGDRKAQDMEMVHRDKPASVPGEPEGEALASNAPGADMAIVHRDMQPQSELPKLHPSKPEVHSVRLSVQEQTRGSDENGGDV